MKIILEKHKCIGCGSCAAVCPKYFDLSEDGKSFLKGGVNSPLGEELNIEDVDNTEDAISLCPVQCIKLEK